MRSTDIIPELYQMLNRVPREQREAAVKTILDAAAAFCNACLGAQSTSTRLYLLLNRYSAQKRHQRPDDER